MKLYFLCIAIALSSVSFSFGQELAGVWAGPFRSTGPSGTFEFSFDRADGAPSVSVAIKFGGREAKGKGQNLLLEGSKVSFSSDVADSDARFSGSVAGARFLGTFEIYEKGRRTLVGAFCLAKAGTPGCAESDLPPVPNAAIAVQRADDSYDTAVASPAYKSDGPRVLFDEAHKNFHKTTSNFKPFAALIRNDGYRLTPNLDPFSESLLRNYDILVISNARGEGAGSAFTDTEIEAVEKWVHGGGSLFLIADHTPFGGYSEKLANRFGVDMSKGYTDDPENRDPVVKDLLFSRENKLLAVHPITNGRNPSEKINRVVSFTGQSLKAASGAVILKLSDSAYDEFPNSDKKISAAGRAQAIALSYGKGRIFVSGEAAMFTAQLSADDRKFGMNVPGIDNRQFTLNVVHWLSHLLN